MNLEAVGIALRLDAPASRSEASLSRLRARSRSPSSSRCSVRESRSIPSPIGLKKRDRQFAGPFFLNWWRRWESNPRPETLIRFFYMLSPQMESRSPALCRQVSGKPVRLGLAPRSFGPSPGGHPAYCRPANPAGKGMPDAGRFLGSQGVIVVVADCVCLPFFTRR